MMDMTTGLGIFVGAKVYILRIVAADYSGNEAQENRDLLITIK